MLIFKEKAHLIFEASHKIVTNRAALSKKAGLSCAEPHDAKVQQIFM